MKHNKILTLTILLVLSSTFTHLFVSPVHAPPVYVISLDANNTSQTDILIQSSFKPNSTFRVSALINATAANPLPNVYAWAFQINYDPTILTPQADPAGGGGTRCSSAPDCADPVAYLGAQAGGCVPVGGCNWDSAASTLSGYFLVSLPPLVRSQGTVYVAFTFTAPHPTVTINQRTLLASVAFELLRKPAAPTAITVSQIAFLDSSVNPLPATIIPSPPTVGATLSTDPKIKFGDRDGNGVWDLGEPVAYDSNNNNNRDMNEIIITGRPYITGTTEPLTSDPKLKFIDTNGNGVWDPGEPVVYSSGTTYAAGDPLIAGSSISETILNDPPHASFTYTNSGTFYTFTSTSMDTDDSIRYYRWDFGDKTGGTNTTSIVVNHDYGLFGNGTAPGLFNVTLRVVDALGATGSARGASGNIIINNQPSHTFTNVGLVELGPLPVFSFTPTNPTVGVAVTFDATASKYQDELVLAGATPLGGTTLLNTDTGTDACVPVTGLPCTIGYVDNDANGVFDPGLDTVVRANDGTTTCNAGSTGGVPNCQIMAGLTITPTGQAILTDTKIAYWDSIGNGIWNGGESVIYDSNGDLVYNGIKAYSWNFGDGTTGTGAITTHTYTTPNSYSATLTLTDNFTGQASLTHNIQVAGLPPAVTVSTTTSGMIVTITLNVTSPSSGASISSIKVDWGDNTTPDSLPGTATTATHTYSTTGSYTITVTATDNSGLKSTKTQAVSITAPGPGLSIPLAAIIAIPIIAIVAIAVLFLRRRKPKTQPKQPQT